MTGIIRISNLDTEKIDKNLWRLNAPLQFKIWHELISIPKNFITDGASRPQFTGSLCNRMSGPEAEAAVLHDFLYTRDSGCNLTRRQADELFYDAMVQNGTRRWRAKAIYMGVRLAGGKFWKKRSTLSKITEQKVQPGEVSIYSEEAFYLE